MERLGKLEQKAITEAYKSAVKTMTNLHSLANPKPFKDRYKDPVPGRPGATVEYKDGILKFVIPEIPPHTKIIDDVLCAKIRDNWIAMMVYAYSKADLDIKFDNAFCLIKVFHNLKAPWDVDNRVYGYVINGIRYAKIIKDDSWNYLTYMVKGYLDDAQPRTEVFITEYEKVEEKLEEIGLF